MLKCPPKWSKYGIRYIIYMLKCPPKWSKYIYSEREYCKLGIECTHIVGYIWKLKYTTSNSLISIIFQQESVFPVGLLKIFLKI